MPRLSVASVYLSGGSEVKPIPLSFLTGRKAPMHCDSDLAEAKAVAAEKTKYRTAKDGFRGKHPRQGIVQNSKETDPS